MKCQIRLQANIRDIKNGPRWNPRAIEFKLLWLYFPMFVDYSSSLCSMTSPPFIVIKALMTFLASVAFSI